MQNETNLISPDTLGPHKGHFGEIYDTLSASRYQQVILAVESAELTLANQINHPPINITWKSPKTTHPPSLNPPSHLESARQAVIDANESSEAPAYPVIEEPSHV